MNTSKLSKIKNCLIDPDGIFKYIQIHLVENNSKDEKVVIRGYKSCNYHPDIFSKFQTELYNLKLNEDVMSYPIGGGRININSKNKQIKVYGYSQTYGRSDHGLSLGLIREDFPDYQMSWSDEGY